MVANPCNNTNGQGAQDRNGNYAVDNSAIQPLDSHMNKTPDKKAEARKERLAEALRANLQRRKGQARGRKTDQSKEPSPSEPMRKD
jgi:hypothetical protein